MTPGEYGDGYRAGYRDALRNIRTRITDFDTSALTDDVPGVIATGRVKRSILAIIDQADQAAGR